MKRVSKPKEPKELKRKRDKARSRFVEDGRGVRDVKKTPVKKKRGSNADNQD